MKEKVIEEALTRAVKMRGGMSLKLVCPGTAGMPDRLVILSGGKVGFVELKAPGQKPRALQKRRHARLRSLGCKVYVIDSLEQIPAVLDEIGGTDNG